MNENTFAKNPWIILPDGTNIFDSEFRNGALELAHERGFSRIRLANEEDIVARYVRSDLFKSGRLGIIGHIHSKRLQQLIARNRIATILLGEESVESWRKTMGGNVTVCSVDNASIGQMAADYLFNRDRYASFVYADGIKADTFNWWTDRRYQAFLTTLREHGYIGDIPRFFAQDATPDINCKRFASIIADLPKPVAVFAANDRIARDLVCFADIARIVVPEEVAILGVDDESAICTTSPIEISSIKIEHHRLGRIAFQLMLHMLIGDPTRDKVILCPPIRVIERASTRRNTPSDMYVSRATDFIRRADASQLTVGTIVAACGASRSYLEKHFKRETGRTILESINDRILNDAKKLLLDTDMPIALIAHQTGFSTTSSLCTLFRRHHGMSMSEFRNMKRMKGIAFPNRAS